MVTLVSPNLIFMPLIAATAYGWGGRVGAGTAVAAFLVAWFILIPPRYSFAPPPSSEWTRAILLAVSYVALVLLGDVVRRLRRANQRLETIIASIADGIAAVSTDRAERARLSALASANAGRFSWDAAAEKLEQLF